MENRSSVKFASPALASRLAPLSGLFALALAVVGCGSAASLSPNLPEADFTIEFHVGSALKTVCQEGAERFNRSNPRLEDGQTFHVTCNATGSGDVVRTTLDLAAQLQDGSIEADDPSFPTILSVDGEVFLSRLIFKMEELYPGQNYIPNIPNAPLIASSPMVLMVPAELAPGLENQDDIFAALVDADNHTDLDPNSRPIPIRFAQTDPTRSNSGLQTLISQFSSAAGRPPERLTLSDIRQHENDVRRIQNKVSQLGVSTSGLARDTIANGNNWASIAAVYESSVIAANSDSGNSIEYQAVYPSSTFSSNARAILPEAPWISDDEREAAEQVIAFFRSREMQIVATEQGLRPGVPGVPLGDKFTAEYGVNPRSNYTAHRPPSAPVVDAMLNTWQDFN